MKARYSILLAALGALPASAQLVGSYNIGGPLAHYNGLAEAFDDLMAMGANGDITFLVHPGTYTGQASLGSIPGSPGIITVRSASNDAADVTLAFDAVFPLPNHIVELDGATNVKFMDLTFHALNNDRARIIHFTNNTDNLKLWDCVFIGSQSTSTNSYFDRVMVFCDQNILNTTDNPDGLNIIGCEFRYGYQAIEVDAEGLGGARAQGLVIAENTFTDQLSVGVYINSAVGEFSQNRITGSAANSYTGIRTSQFDGGSKIQRNVIQVHAALYGCTGIEAGNTQNTTGNQISNNMITVSAATGEVWGIGAYNLWDMSVVYNSVAVLGGSASSKAFFHLSNFADAQDVVIRNNLFANYAGGAALESTVPGNIATEDHNDLYTTGPALAITGGTSYATLAAYQSGTGDGAADLNVDPAFPFLPDLHVNSCVLDNVGDYFYVPAGDIDYESRGNPVSDIGADEFTFSSGTVSTAITVDALDLPYTLTAPAGPMHNWNTGSIAESIVINAAGTYWCLLTDVNGCTYSVQWVVIVDFGTGLPQVMEANTLRVFPNPANEAVQFSGITGRVAYGIMDTNGRLVLRGITAEFLPIDVGNLVPGVYTMRMSSPEGPSSACFVKW